MLVIPSEVEESLIANSKRCLDHARHDSYLFVNLDHESTAWIDITPVHSRGIKRQSDVALAVDRDQSTGAAELRHLGQNGLRSLLERHSPIFHQSPDIVSDRNSNAILAIARSRNSTGHIVCVCARADDRRITNPPGALVRRAAG